MSISASSFSPKITVQASEHQKAAEGVKIHLRTDSAISLEGLPGIDKKITIQATHLNPNIEEKIKNDRLSKREAVWTATVVIGHESYLITLEKVRGILHPDTHPLGGKITREHFLPLTDEEKAQLATIFTEVKETDESAAPKEKSPEIKALEKVGMSEKEALDIVHFVDQFKAGIFKVKGEDYIEGTPFYISKEDTRPHLKCSLSIKANGDVLVLLKRKKGIHDCFKMNERGQYKTVKTALNLRTEEIEAFSVINVTQWIKNFREDDSRDTKEERLKRVELIKEECRLLSKFSPDIAINVDDIITYTKKEELKVAFPSPKALGDLFMLKDVAEKIRNSPKDLSHILKGLSSNLAAIHAEGYIYRDAKMDNLLVMEEKREDGFLPWSIHRADFGFTKKENELSNTGVSGTLKSFSPEMSDHYESIFYDDRRDFYKDDIWSEGAMYFELLTGKNNRYNGMLVLCQKKGRYPDYDDLIRLAKELEEDVKKTLIKAGYSEALSLIIASMFVFNPENRPTSKELALRLNHLTEEDFKRVNSLKG